MNDSIGYTIKRLHQTTRQMLDQILRAYGLSPSQSEILYYLLMHDGQTQAELGRKLKVSAPTISKMIQGLVKKGYIIRRSDASDARSKQVFLTERGHQFKEKITLAQQQVETALVQGFTERDMHILTEYLKRMYDNIG